MAPAAPDALSPRRQRLTRGERLRQLLDVAWRVIREDGADALTLPRLAQEAGVAKPVVYGHFGTREGLLAALYEDFDARQTAVMDAALAASPPSLADKAAVIASCYVDCVLTQGREIPGILAALAGSPDLERIKRDYQLVFFAKCRAVFGPFTRSSSLTPASFWAMLGAADALSSAAAQSEVTPHEAKDELFASILAMVDRNRPAGPEASPSGRRPGR